MQTVEYSDEMFAGTNASIPAGRNSAPEEIADAFFYLASKDASFLTGHELVVDGGETVGATTTRWGGVWTRPVTEDVPSPGLSRSGACGGRRRDLVSPENPPSPIPS